jgi:hypothetical protein
MAAVARVEAAAPAMEAEEAAEVLNPQKVMAEVRWEAEMVPLSHPMLCNL